MARIPDDQIQRLKDEVAVQRLVEAAGVELKKLGKDLAGCCPFHADDTASLIVTPAKNLWHCFGCQVGGGPIDWVMKLKGVSFRHAVELLKDDTSLAAEPLAAGAPVKRTTVRSLPPPVTLDADDRALLVQVVGYYHQSLKDSPEALAYLQSRGLAHPDLIDHFQLGYANRTLGLRLPEKNRKAGADIRARLEKVGIYRASGHEHFNGSVVVPVLDDAGGVCELYGRKITPRLRPGTPLHLYLPAHHNEDGQARGRGVFNLAALQASREIILCESIIDALTFWCAGYRNVTTAYGVEGFTGELLAAFKRHGTQRILIAYDRDEAGERAAAKLAPALMSEGIECYRIQFPKGMDANEYALKVTPATKSLGLLIRRAAWLGAGNAPERPAAPVTSAATELQAKMADGAYPESASSYQNSSESIPAEVKTPLPPLAAEPQALPATPVPEAARGPWVEVVQREAGREVHIRFGEGPQARVWRVRGLEKNLSPDTLKVNVRIAIGLLSSADGGAFHVDTLDLYNAKQRGHFAAQAHAETGVDERTLKTDLGRVLMALETVQDEAIAEVLQPTPADAMTDTDRAAALALLKTPDLPARILADFQAAGVVGEATNKLVGYLAAVSRKLDRPLAVVIQSSSAAGKSSLMDAILSFVPEEERIQYSAMTGQSLFYMGQTNLKHKILAIAEEEGAHRASYALKLLQSEGELTIASTGSDPATGNLITQEYKVEGPMSLFMTTTAIDIDEELMNRCLVLSVNEDREQTRAIHQLQRQRRTLAGLTKKHEKQAILAVHRNAQRLLRPLAVVNPWADQLTFLDDRTRTRRDHEKYLTLIDVIALLHQHQRTIKSATVADNATAGAPQTIEYIEATLADIELANRIAHEVLGVSLDELPPQTRRVLASVRELVHARMAAQGLPQREVRFARGELRAATRTSDTQLKVHLARLAEMEYLLIHRAQRGQGYVYELLYDGDAQEGVHLSGLIDVQALKTQTQPQPRTYDAQRTALGAEQSAPGRGVAGGQPDGGPKAKTAASPHETRLYAQTPQQASDSRATPTVQARSSYLHPLAA
ncbi:MAG: CHC2 zinc finger domain-containing protein [Acidovorax temperans]|uniref:CHC2 zinc finger domain-containing protein n=1 Tax=Acidovorax temperans TaxID=80878 RepID=UPI00391AECC2